METNYNLLQSDLQIDAVGSAHLKETAKWAKFLSILGFVVCALLVFMAFFGMSMFTKMGNVEGMEGSANAAAIGGTMFTILYLIIAVIYFFLCLFLYKFAVKMQAALNSSDQMSLNESLHNQKMLYKVMGIITIVYLAFILLALVVGIGAASMAN